MELCDYYLENKENLDNDELDKCERENIERENKMIEYFMRLENMTLPFEEFKRDNDLK